MFSAMLSYLLLVLHTRFVFFGHNLLTISVDIFLSSSKRLQGILVLFSPFQRGNNAEKEVFIRVQHPVAHAGPVKKEYSGGCGLR